MPAGPVPRRWAHHARTARRVCARDRLLRRLAGSHGGCTASDVCRDANVERVLCPANRMHDGQKLLEALDVPIPATRARTQAHAENRAGAMARRHRSKIPWGIRTRAVSPDGWRGTNRVRRRLAEGDHWYEYPRYI